MWSAVPQKRVVGRMMTFAPNSSASAVPCDRKRSIEGKARAVSPEVCSLL